MPGGSWIVLAFLGCWALYGLWDIWRWPTGTDEQGGGDEG